MKNLHWIIWITLLLSNVIKIVKTQTTDKPMMPLDKIKIVDYFNDIRRKVAKAQDVANMWKLEWDEDLVETAKKVVEKWSTLGDTWVLFSSQGDAVTEPLIQEEWDKFVTDPSFFQSFITSVNSAGWYGKKKDPNQSVSFFAPVLGLLPVQTKIGCIPNADVFPPVEKTYKLQIACCVGPFGMIGDQKIHLARQVTFGPAGSECKNGHGEDGLCVPESGSPTTPPPAMPSPPEKKNKMKGKYNDENEEEDDDTKYDIILVFDSVGFKGTLFVFIMILVMIF